jgi:signal peptidase I
MVSIGVAILAVAGVRVFCIGSYRISTGAMKPVLQEGDCVLVNKWHGSSNPGRNRIAVFGDPSGQAAGSSSLFLGRCVGMPGDTLQITADGYTVNGRLIRIASEKTFCIRKNIRPALLETLDRLDIPLRSVAEDSLYITIRLSAREESLLRENLHQVLPVEPAPAVQRSFTFVIPSAGWNYRPDSASLFLYSHVITQETGGRVQADGGKLFVDGEALTVYRFARDYYWMLSDDGEAVDSRHLGLIPRTHVAGNVWLCWYGKNRSHPFKRIN